jgi:hypothetical protein
MARVADWWCHSCKAEWVAPVGDMNHVVTVVCRVCGENRAMAWGRAAFEDYALRVIDEVPV